MAISGDKVVVGAGQNDNPNNSGSAYIFTRNAGSWTQQPKLTAYDKAADDKFGNSVAVSGDVVVVGAFLDDDNASNSGSAYVNTPSPVCSKWVYIFLRLASQQFFEASLTK